MRKKKDWWTTMTEDQLKLSFQGWIWTQISATFIVFLIVKWENKKCWTLVAFMNNNTPHNRHHHHHHYFIDLTSFHVVIVAIFLSLCHIMSWHNFPSLSRFFMKTSLNLVCNDRMQHYLTIEPLHNKWDGMKQIKKKSCSVVDFSSVWFVHKSKYQMKEKHLR